MVYRLEIKESREFMTKYSKRDICAGPTKCLVHSKYFLSCLSQELNYLIQTKLVRSHTFFWHNTK